MRTRAVLGVAAVAVLLAGCGGGSKSSQSSFNQAQASAQVKTAYATVFSKGGSLDTKASYIEDGDQLKTFIGQLFQSYAKTSIQAKVKTVTFPSHTAADVKFDIYVGGSDLAPNTSGKAVYQGGKWKVAKSTFCGLAALAPGVNGKLPPACTTK